MKNRPVPYQIKAFEDKVVESFKNKEILSPVHLDDGNHESLWQIFHDFGISEGDWICCTWRSHAKCLLKGVPEDTLLNAVKRGKSIGLCFPEHKVVSSAIVGGNIPIAVGLALAEKLQKTTNKVYCFIGEMTAESGIFEEALKYSTLHSLPLYFVIEDNGKSVCTPTTKVWNKEDRLPTILNRRNVFKEEKYWHFHDINVIYYQYQSKYPHSGVGERITF